jgi:hypothetical protein
MVEPPVWVARASGTMKSATAAPDPLDEPPGVRSGSRGLRVGGTRPPQALQGFRLAQNHCTRGAPHAHAISVFAWLVSRVDGRIVLSGKVAGVDDVLHPHRNPVHWAAAGFAVARSRLGERVLGVEKGPGPDQGLAFHDPIEQSADASLAAELALRHRRRGGRGRQLPQIAHAVGFSHHERPTDPGFS